MFAKKQRSSGSHVAGLLATFIAVSIALLLVLNKQAVIDQISVWQYHPTAEITSFVDRTGMSSTGTFDFYASQPSVKAATSFNQKCSRKEQSTAILGCYDGERIYIYDVTDSRLDGIKEVTAAHEMLHAAYARMSSNERESVDTLLEAEYAILKDDKDFAARMAFYERTEPGERDNELNSVIGTEVATISPALETHYKKYFTDRSKVVALHTKYASVFANLQQRGQDISAQLTTMGTSIEQRSTEYNNNVQQLNDAIQSFNSRANNGGFSSQAQFQNERSSLTAQANRLADQRAAINADVVTYNKLREELISVATQSTDLNKSIDSSLAPAPSL